MTGFGGRALSVARPGGLVRLQYQYDFREAHVLVVDAALLDEHRQSGVIESGEVGVALEQDQRNQFRITGMGDHDMLGAAQVVLEDLRQRRALV